jgi:hypothetical protein
LSLIRKNWLQVLSCFQPFIVGCIKLSKNISILHVLSHCLTIYQNQTLQKHLMSLSLKHPHCTFC